ncbi:hypothetical protein Ancab_030087 [Ancistrocladus abbreviatus]
MQKASTTASQITLVKSRFREISPICISQKKEPTSCSMQVEEDIDFVKQLEVNEDECSWLSSEEASMVLEEEWEILRQDLQEADVLETLLLNSVDNELKNSSITCFENAKSSCDTLTSVSSDTDLSSSFSDLEVTEAQFSLINLDANDSKWISYVDSELQELQSDILSPTHQINWASDFCSSGTSTTSATNSTHASSQDEMALDLLSVNWDQADFDEPLFWPFHLQCDWSLMWDSFCQSPREGIHGLQSPQDEFITPGSVGQKLVGGVKNSQVEWKKRFLYVSRLHASKITKFKRRCQKLAAAQRINAIYSRFCRAAEEIMRMVPSVMDYGFEEATDREVNSTGTNGKLTKEHKDVGSSCRQSSCKYSASNENYLTPFSSYTDSSLFCGLDKTGGTETQVCSINLESEDSRCISNAGSEWEELRSIYNFPSAAYKINWGSECCPSSIRAASTVDSIDKESQTLSSDLLSEFAWGFDEPLFWPFDESYDWSQTWEPFCQSPCRCIYDLQSPEYSFETPISVRLRQYGRKTKFKEGQKKRRFLHVSGRNAVNITEFKWISSKNAAARMIKAMQLRFARSRSAQEFMRMVSCVDYNVERINEAEVNRIGTHGKLLEEDITEREEVLTETDFSLNDSYVHNDVDQQPSCSQSFQYGYSISPEDSTATSANSGSYTNSPFLHDLDRIDMWLCLINLEAEDSMWISDVDPEWEDLKPGSPRSPFLDISTHEHKNSQHEWISELLSGSVDIDEMDFEEPLFWPFDNSHRWSATWDCFCLSPR